MSCPSMLDFGGCIPALTDLAISAFNSSIDPMQISSLLSFVLQIGKGVPQKRDLDKFQSTRFSSQLPNRPVPVDSGFQLIDLFNSTMRSLRAVVLMNHESRG